MVKKNTKLLFAASATLAGNIIGAGILGLPYVFSRSGFFIGLFWLFFIGIIMLFVNLALGEITLRTKKIHQLPGYAREYLGKKAEKIMLFVVLFGIYSALLAYLIGEGQSISQLITGTLNYSILFGILFWLLMVFLLGKGLRGLKKIESYGVVAIIIIILYLLISNIHNIQLENLMHYNTSNLFFPFGVVLFALLGLIAIPELNRELKLNASLMKKSIIIGMIIPFLLYIIFSLVFLGILGQEIPQIATLAFGSLILILGMFTMFSCFFVHNFALKDIFKYDLKAKKINTIFFVYLFPLILYLIVSFLNLSNFTKIIGLGGAVSGGLTGIMILLIAKKAKQTSKVKPVYKIPINWFIIGLISLIFILGIIYEVWLFIH